MVVAQLLFPLTTWAPPRTYGAASATSGHCAGMSFASASDSVTALPVPSRTPDLLVLPGVMMMMLLPMLAIWSWMRCVAPEPIDTVAITLATPITMPSMVSAERSLFIVRARNAMPIDDFNFFLFFKAPPRQREGRRVSLACAGGMDHR